MAATIATLLHATAQRCPDRDFLITADRTVTWAQVDAASVGVAEALVARGLRRGDRVGLMLGNSIDFVIAYVAIARARLVCVPLNPAYTSPELAVMLADCDARVLLVEAATAGVARDAGDALPALDVVDVGGAEWSRWCSSVPTAAELAPADAGDDELALLLFTAGTSGRPKAAMLTHRALLANIELIVALDDPPAASASDVALVVLPMFHVYGLNAVLGTAVAVGATCVLVDRFDPVESLRIVEDRGVTSVAGAPTMFQAWLAVPELRRRLSGVRLLSSGGAPLPARVLAEFADASGHAIHEGYGMTETAPVVATTLVSGAPKPGSVGRPLPGVEVRLVDEDGDDVDEGDPGEVWVRGPSVFAGYWPDGAGGPDADGWFRSGDVAYADEEGDLHLVDRRREVILVNGFNVYPREIELAIDAMDTVAEVAVLGVPDDRTGESVCALVVPRAGSTLTAQEVIDHCATRLARFKCPTVVRVVDTLPHSTTGKVAKGRLRDVHGEL